MPRTCDGSLESFKILPFSKLRYFPKMAMVEKFKFKLGCYWSKISNLPWDPDILQIQARQLGIINLRNVG